jgi:hypothetical protein
MTLRVKWRQAVAIAEEVWTLGERATIDALYVYCLFVCNLFRTPQKSLCRPLQCSMIFEQSDCLFLKSRKHT